MNQLNVQSIEAEADEFSSFMEVWGDEIEEIFPHFSEEDAVYSEILSLEVNHQMVGVFVFQFKGERLHVNVDYVIPEYRNQGIGQSFFRQKIEEFKKMGFKAIVSLSNNKIHQDYLVSCGFKQQPKHPDWYQLDLQ